MIWTSDGDTNLSLSLLPSPLLLLLTGGSGLLILRFFSATSAIILPTLSSPPPLALSLPLLFGSSLDFFTGGGLHSGLSFETLRCLLNCLLFSPDCLREVEGGGGFCLYFSIGGGRGGDFCLMIWNGMTCNGYQTYQLQTMNLIGYYQVMESVAC